MINRKRRHAEMAELRSLGLTLAQTSHATSRRTKSRGPLVLAAVALFAVAGGAGSYLVFGQATPDARPMAAAPAPQPAPAALPAAPAVPAASDVAAAPAAVDVNPDELRVALESLAPERSITLAEYLANMQSLPIDLPTEADADPVPETAPEVIEVAARDCVAALDAEAASLIVPFEPYAVETPNPGLVPVFELASRIANCDGAYLVVAGHADPSGNETQNLVLSWQRAEFVVSALTQAGIAPDRVEAIGFGSRRPISEGAAGSDDTLNRRVDFVVREALP